MPTKGEQFAGKLAAFLRIRFSRDNGIHRPLEKKRLAETDFTRVRAEVAAVNPYTARSYLMAGESVIKEYEQKQEDERNSARIERAERTLELARKAQQQAAKSYHQSCIAIAIAGVAAVVAIALI